VHLVLASSSYFLPGQGEEGPDRSMHQLPAADGSINFRIATRGMRRVLKGKEAEEEGELRRACACEGGRREEP